MSELPVTEVPSLEGSERRRVASSASTPILEPRRKLAMIWNDERTSYMELLKRVRLWARAMPEAGARVVLFSENSPAWLYAAYAIWANEGILVPVDHLSTAEELAYVLNDCEPTLLLCSRHLQATATRSVGLTRHAPRVAVLEDLAQVLGSSEAEPTDPLVVDESQLATIVYTSGTTGAPKGVMLSFGNLLANVRAVVKAGYFTPKARVLLLLPLHHVLPLAGSLLAPLFGGSTIVFATSMAGEELVATVRREAVTTIVGVPRFYDLLHRALHERIDSNRLVVALYRLAQRVRSRAFSRLLFGSVHRKFGGALKHLVCGGAALDPETAKTFDTLGFAMCEGYGMTECSPMISFPRLEHIQLGSCGQVLDGCDVRLSEEGEILTRGPNVMQGYYNRPEETRQILRDGWLHTGDLGQLDVEGNLYVTGRLKEVLVLSSGKKVSPAEVELGVEHAGGRTIREAGVFLDGDVLHAVVVPNWSELPTDRAKATGWLERKCIARYNATVSPYRRVARLSVATGELPRTRLGKLRRHQLPQLAECLSRLASPAVASATSTDATVERLIAFLGRPTRGPISAESRLTQDLGLDSLGRVELSVFIRRAFGVEISESRLSELETLRELSQFIDQCKNDDLVFPQLDASRLSWAELLLPKTPPALPSSSGYHLAIIHLSRLLVRALFRVRARGAERVPKGPFLLVPNHQSYLDGLFVCSCLPPSTVRNTLFYAKERHVRRPWLRFLAERCNTIVVDPKQGVLQSLQQLAAGLRRGNSVILFPEGTRCRDGELGPFKDSYALLARELHVPVVPVVIDGAYRVLPAGRSLPRLFGRIQLTYLAPIRYEATETVTEFNRRVRSVISDVLEGARVTGEVETNRSALP